MAITIKGRGKTMPFKTPGGRPVRAGDLKPGKECEIDMRTGRIIPPPKAKKSSK